MRWVEGTESEVGTRSDVSDLVVGHVLARVAGGESISAITRKGLIVSCLRTSDDGEIERVVCLISRKTFERRYRKALAGRIAKFRRDTPACRQPETRFIGISAPNLPLSLSHGKTLKRGRPRKMRSSKTPS